MKYQLKFQNYMQLNIIKKFLNLNYFFNNIFIYLKKIYY